MLWSTVVTLSVLWCLCKSYLNIWVDGYQTQTFPVWTGLKAQLVHARAERFLADQIGTATFFIRYPESQRWSEMSLLLQKQIRINIFIWGYWALTQKKIVMDHRCNVVLRIHLQWSECGQHKLIKFLNFLFIYNVKTLWDLKLKPTRHWSCSRSSAWSPDDAGSAPFWPLEPHHWCSTHVCSEGCSLLSSSDGQVHQSASPVQPLNTKTWWSSWDQSRTMANHSHHAMKLSGSCWENDKKSDEISCSKLAIKKIWRF